jgi:tripartite-type tricarboxylate transporter receptor subunit TctC
MKAIVALLMFAAALSAGAQPFPARPIRIVSPYGPGGTVDALVRPLQEPLAKLLGQPVLIDNRAGAGGAMGTREVARSAPDGYTLIAGNNGPNAILPALQKDIGYDPLKSFEPVAILATVPMVVTVHPGVPAANLKEFLALARSDARGVEYASVGIGSMGHFATEMLARAAGVKLVHVPYNGGGPATASILAGDTRLYISSFNVGMKAQAEAGKLRILAVTSPQPVAALPGVPAVAELVPGYAAEVWFGLLAPAGTPAAIVAQLHKAISEALALPDIQQRYRAIGADIQNVSPARFREQLAAEVQRWTVLVKETGIKAE